MKKYLQGIVIIACLAFNPNAWATHDYQTLKAAAEHYIGFLNEQGMPNAGPSPELGNLFANNLKLVISGKTDFSTSDRFIPRLNNVRAQLGPWTIESLDTIASPEDQACVVRYVFKSSKGGVYTTIAILRLDDKGLISEINEVYNKFEG